MMANPERVEFVKARAIGKHLDLLRGGRDGVNAWNNLRKVQNWLELPTLADADLRNCDLERVDLSLFDLRRCDLRGANLGGADLGATNLKSADLRNTDLCSTSFFMADLQDAKLSHAKAVQANFFKADLRRAKLRKVDCRRAEFRATNLTGSDLKNIILCEAEFVGASLKGANLRRSFLQGARIIGTDASGADFTGATFGSTTIAGAVSVFDFGYLAKASLSEAVGLEKTIHQSPSYIGADLLSNQLPLNFLRGCGLSDALIDFMPSLVGNPFEFYSCFISYCHTDKQFARQLYDRLQGKGIRCWLDEHAIKPGDDIYASVDKGIRLWDKVLLCCSEASLTSWWVEREIDTAIEKEMEFRKAKGEQILKIIPLDLDGALFKWEGSHGAELRKRLAPDFTNWKRNGDKFEREFENVVQALRTDDGPPPPEPKLGKD